MKELTMTVMQALPSTMIPRDADVGPAVLRLQMLEMLGRGTTRQDETSADRLLEMRRTMADRPSASLADVLAKLRMARLEGGAKPDWAERLDLRLIESAIADLERMPAL